MINWNETSPKEKTELMHELAPFQTCQVAEYLSTTERTVQRQRNKLGIIGGKERLIHTPEYTKLVKSSRQKAKEQCGHCLHVQKCSTCNQILSSESKVNIAVELPEKFLINGVEYTKSYILLQLTLAVPLVSRSIKVEI